MASRTPIANVMYRCKCKSCRDKAAFRGDQFVRQPGCTGTDVFRAAHFKAPCGHQGYLGRFERVTPLNNKAFMLKIRRCHLANIEVEAENLEEAVRKVLAIPMEEIEDLLMPADRFEVVQSFDKHPDREG